MLQQTDICRIRLAKFFRATPKIKQLVRESEAFAVTGSMFRNQTNIMPIMASSSCLAEDVS